MANKRNRRRKTKVRTPATTQPDRTTDSRRGLAVEVTAVDGKALDEPGLAVIVEPVLLESGETLWFQAPFTIPFYLLKAKALRDAAEHRRLAALSSMKPDDEGGMTIHDAFAALDAIEDLALAVIAALTAIEAHANDMIGRLPDDAMVEIPTRLGGSTVAVMRDKAAMDWLPLSDKIARAAPLLDHSASIKGTVAWQKYKRLSRLRNALVHPRRIAVNDPLKPSAFGKLLRGDGSSAPEDAAAVIEALEPGFVPAEIREEFGLPPRPPA
jgi:hypothetical protein